MLRLFCLLVLCTGWVWTDQLVAQESAADLLPDSTVLYAEIPRPAEFVQEIKDHAVWDELFSTAAGEKVQTNTQFIQGQLVLSFLELRLGKTWQEALTVLSQGGLAIGVDAATEGVALIAQGTTEEEVTSLRDTLMEMARDEAKRKGESDPYTTTEYRGITVYQTKDGGFVTHGRWFLTANKGDLGKKLLDQVLDGGNNTLARKAEFQELAKAHRGSDVWGFVDLATIRADEKVQKALFGHAENPLAELLVGGLQEVLRHTPHVAATVDLEPEVFHLNLIAPHDPAQISEQRTYWFGTGGTGSAPALVQVPEQIFGLTTYRNVSEMWLRAGDLFNESMNDKLAEADANLTTLFAGKDFGTDILGSFEPGWQLVITRQAFAAGELQPAIKLPSFGLLAELKEPETSRRELRRIFQSLIGFLNVAGAMNGQPQMELNFDTANGIDLVSADYLPEAGEEKSQTAAINYNFSPSVAFKDRYFVLCSTSDLARTLLGAAGTPVDAARRPVTNTAGELDTRALSEALKDNEGQLIAQNMLEKGHTREEAGEEIGLLLELLNITKSVELNLIGHPEEKSLRLSLEVR